MDAALDSDLGAELRAAMRAEFADLHRFIDRRIAELSAEVHGAVTLMDYSEANLSGQLSRVHEQILGLLAAPAAATRNSGLELESVVQATEQAATQIMEAAEAIGDWVSSGARDPESVHAVAERINSIFEACTFQDLTGQRIRRAIEHLQKVESMLGGLIHSDAAETDADRPPPPPLHLTTTSHDGVATPDLDQDEIDRLLNG